MIIEISLTAGGDAMDLIFFFCSSVKNGRCNSGIKVYPPFLSTIRINVSILPARKCGYNWPFENID